MIFDRKAKAVTPPEKDTAPVGEIATHATLLSRLLADLGAPIAQDVIGEALAASPADETFERAQDALSKIGFQAQTHNMPIADLPRHCVPAFVMDDTGNGVVLHELTDETAVISRADPDGHVGQETVARTTLNGAARALWFYPEDADDRGVQGRLSAINPIKTLGGQRVAWILVAAFLSNVLGIATSLFVMVVYDRVLPNKALESLYALAIGVAIAVLFDTVLRNARSAIVEAATERADRRVTEDIFDQFVSASSRNSDRKIGQLASVVRDYEHYRDFMTSAAVLAFVDLPFVFVFVYVIWHIAGAVAIVPLVAVPVVIGGVMLAQPIVTRSSKDASRVAQTRQSLLVEVLSGLEPLRVSGAYSLLKRRFLSQAGQQRVATTRARDLSSVVGAMISVVQQSVQVAVIVIGFHLFVSQQITMGAIMGSVILSGRAMGPLSRVGQAMGRISSVRVAYRNLHEFLSTQRMGEVAHATTATNTRAVIDVSNVTYRPQSEMPALFSGLSVTINAGEKVAILGRTGSGKTTFLRLLNGLCEPETGAVFVGGQAVAAIPRARIPHQIGTVFQMPWLFAGSLFDNVSMAHERLDEAVVAQALVAVGMGSFPLDYQVAEQGANLSGGQKQAISLARALAFDPPVLLMDEPTSAMDAQLEARIVTYLRTKKANRTMMIVTHKAALIGLCDRILIMDQGRIVEDMSVAEYRKKTAKADANPTEKPRPPRTITRKLGPLKRPSQKAGNTQ